jgi:hypothetical protein
MKSMGGPVGIYVKVESSRISMIHLSSNYFYLVKSVIYILYSFTF